MKKISLIAISLLASLAIANTAYSRGNIYAENSCELKVAGGGHDPCVVINRVGFKDVVDGEEAWVVEPSMKDCEERWDEEGDNRDTYFECWEQEYVAQNCDLKTTLTKVVSDRKYCSVGEHDGYDTALVLFQMKNVVTEKLRQNPSSNTLVKNNNTFIPTIVDQPLNISKQTGQIIFSDARTFFSHFLYRPNASNDEWTAALVDDRISEVLDEVPFFNPEFNGTNPIILDTQEEHAVSIKIELEDQSAFAFEFTGPAAPLAHSPRVVIRGLDVALNTGQGFIKTNSFFDLKFSRTRIDVKSLSADAVFVLPSVANLSFPRNQWHPASNGVGLEVNLGANHVPVFKFDGLPKISTLLAMDSGLEISYEYNPAANDEHPKPIEIVVGGEEQVETCTVVRCDGPGCLECNEDNLKQKNWKVYLVFKPICDGASPQNCHFDISLSPSPVHLADSEDAPAPIVYAVNDIVNGKLEPAGARIEFDTSDLPEEGNRIIFHPAPVPDFARAQDNLAAVDLIRTSPDDDEDNEDDVPSCDENEVFDEQENRCVCEDGYIRINGECALKPGGGSPGPDVLCDANEHFNENLDECVCNYGYSRNDEGVCTNEADLTECAEGEILVLGSCFPDPDYEPPTSADDDAFDAGGGCSLMASQGTGGWARFLLVVPALLGLALCRRLRRKRS